MKLLVSGFEPFGGRRVNASWELARRLPARAGRWETRAVRLPVVYGKAWPALAAAIAEYKPRAVVALGEAPGRKVRLERVAINLREGRADNAGRTAEGRPLDSEGRCAYLTALPLEKMARALARRRVPHEVSLCAGTYLCNEVFYFLMRAQAARRFPNGAGFVHVPRDTHKRFPGALRVLVAALEQGTKSTPPRKNPVL